MALVFGFDIGTTSIGFAVIRHDHSAEPGAGTIKRLGVRIFPEARDPKANTPLNQERRQARLRRRHLRRRRKRRQELAGRLYEYGLLPKRDSPDWRRVMTGDPYDLRKRAFEGETLTNHQVGRAIYHLAQRRHFKGRDIDEVAGDDQQDKGAKQDKAAADEEKAGKQASRATSKMLKEKDVTLGAWLAQQPRKRNQRATRDDVESEFDKVWAPLLEQDTAKSLRTVIFHQRPTFWRLNTLGQCPFVPGARPCPKGSWLSQQRRMLEKLNNLQLWAPEQRPLDSEERQAILNKLKTQASMSWKDVRNALVPLYKSRGEASQEKSFRFNLEEGGEKKLLGNAAEKKLADIFGITWETLEPSRKDAIRKAVPEGLLQADYKEIGDQRVVIVPAHKRQRRREEAVARFKAEFDLSEEQAIGIKDWKLPTGWDAYSKEALQKILPLLEAGIRFGDIINGPKLEEWRESTFPQARPVQADQAPDRLPSPADKEEREHIANLRNPTVVRARNELRKVVNNLIDMFGKPDRIHIELARDIGHSKREREEKVKGIKDHENRREKAKRELEKNGIAQPSRKDVDKWLLWEECGHYCPYTGDAICYKALFVRGEFEVEHIWPRSRSLDDSFSNKTLCRSDVNKAKGNRTPYEYFAHNNPDEWASVCRRLKEMQKRNGMSRGKIKKFLAEKMPDDFTSRQLNDTAYIARDAVAYLSKLWPDLGHQNVSAVSGRVTAHLRRLWGLNNILGDTGEKNRADHRHHAIDALTVACTHSGLTKKLSGYWQAKDEYHVKDPQLDKPWETIRMDAEKAVEKVIVSHRVRKKVSGQLHKETVYGDTCEEEETNEVKYSLFVTRKKVEELSKTELDQIRDEKVRAIIKDHVESHGGNPKKAFTTYPKHNPEGQEIRKVRLLKKQQKDLMTRASTGWADESSKHHIAIYKLPSGKVIFKVVSLLEASQRLSRRQSIVEHEHDDNAQFLMSLSKGDSLHLVKDNQHEIMIVQSISSNGQVTLAHHMNADKKNKWIPKANSLIDKYHAKKISVDPIGRIRPAND